VSADKQQELDLPTVKVEQVEPQKERPEKQEKNRPMSQISGVRKLKHTNSFTGIVPKYGVDTPHAEELGKVRDDDDDDVDGGDVVVVVVMMMMMLMMMMMMMWWW
jgi:cAMP-specific phosphodiesterase 4